MNKKHSYRWLTIIVCHSDVESIILSLSFSTSIFVNLFFFDFQFKQLSRSLAAWLWISLELIFCHNLYHDFRFVFFSFGNARFYVFECVWFDFCSQQICQQFMWLHWFFSSSGISKRVILKMIVCDEWPRDSKEGDRRKIECVSVCVNVCEWGGGDKEVLLVFWSVQKCWEIAVLSRYSRGERITNPWTRKKPSRSIHTTSHQITEKW